MWTNQNTIGISKQQWLSRMACGSLCRTKRDGDLEVAKLRQKFTTFVRLPTQGKVWFFIAYFLSGGLRLGLLMLPFRWIAPKLGTHYDKIQLNVLATQQQQLQARLIGRIIELAGKYTLWESKCLVQAMMASAFLAHYNIPYVLHLGVAKSTSEMKAHAWLRVGQWVITGRKGHRTYTIVSTIIAPGVLPTGNVCP